MLDYTTVNTTNASTDTRSNDNNKNSNNNVSPHRVNSYMTRLCLDSPDEAIGRGGAGSSFLDSPGEASGRGGSWSSFRLTCVSFVIGLLCMILLPYIHIGVFYMKFWIPDKAKIDRSKCTCSCFDTISRGTYEKPGNSKYKHLYINATRETLWVWSATVLFVLMAYESVKSLVRVASQSRIRKSMLFLFVINIYPNYYSWWSIYSYVNEEFFKFFWHQTFYTVTELISTCFILNLCDHRKAAKPWKLWIIIAINFMHILSAGVDQFIHNVVQGLGKNFQIVRDIGLMLPDIAFIVIPLWEMRMYAKRHSLPFRKLLSLESAITVTVIVCGGTLVVRLLSLSF